MTEPLVSVILPVYNAGEFLKEAIKSILTQSYSNFEFIIINDGSSDDSEKVILSYNDSRVRYISQVNQGLGATLNTGLSLAKGTFIARQDQDDISHPTRLKKQVDFLELHSNILLLGTRAQIVEKGSQQMKFHNHATHPADLKFDLLFNNPFVHSSVMFRKEVTDLIGVYNPDRNAYEDYDLWSRMASRGDVANLSEVLVDYRHHEKGLSKNLSNFSEHALFEQGKANLEQLLGLKEEVLNDVLALFHSNYDLYSGTSAKSLENGMKLIADKIYNLYPDEKLRVEERKNQYLKIVRYRLNIFNREKFKTSPLKVLLLKIESKLQGLQSEIIND
ncbi:MAG: glycosyltransferase [bacterium]|nr:glycosyltransferase [bacterium]